MRILGWNEMGNECVPGAEGGGVVEGLECGTARQSGVRVC